jgi:hypothetical protein
MRNFVNNSFAKSIMPGRAQMNSKKLLRSVLVSTLITVLLTGCGPGQLLGPTVTPTSTSTPVPTNTPKATPTPVLPTYSDIVSTYPNGADFCGTDAEISESSDGSLSLSGSVAYSDARGMEYQCYGTKLTATTKITLEGITYEPGTKLTVDKDLNWIQVSSWE